MTVNLHRHVYESVLHTGGSHHTWYTLKLCAIFISTCCRQMRGALLLQLNTKRVKFRGDNSITEELLILILLIDKQ